MRVETVGVQSEWVAGTVPVAGSVGGAPASSRDMTRCNNYIPVTSERPPMGARRSTHHPTEAERDERIRLDLPLSFEEAARVLVAVKPGDLPDDESEADK